MSKRSPLTAAAADGLRKPGKYYAGRCLTLHVKTPNSRLWFFRYSRAGQEHLMSLGRVDDVTMAEAYAKARAARRLLLLGIDPLAERRRGRDPFAALCEAPTEPAPASPPKAASSKPRRERVHMPTGRPRGRPRKQLPVTPAVPDPTVLFVRPEQAARACDVSLSTMKKLLRTGRVRSTTIGRMRLVELASLRTLGADR